MIRRVSEANANNNIVVSLTDRLHSQICQPCTGYLLCIAVGFILGIMALSAPNEDSLSLTTDFAFTSMMARFDPHNILLYHKLHKSHSIYANIKHCIIIAGHGLYTGSSYDSLNDESNWALLPYQTGQVPAFVNHIQQGLKLLSEDGSALLIFSGGEISIDAGPISLGTTNFQIAKAKSFFGFGSDPDGSNKYEANQNENEKENFHKKIWLFNLE